MRGGIWEGGEKEYEEALGEAGGDFVAEVVYCSAGFGRGCAAFSLELFDGVVEDLEGCGCGVEGVLTGWIEAPSESGAGKVGSERG